MAQSGLQGPGCVNGVRFGHLDRRYVRTVEAEPRPWQRRLRLLVVSHRDPFGFVTQKNLKLEVLLLPTTPH